MMLLLLSVFYGVLSSKFYISSSEGSDENPGTSPDAPWKTFSVLKTQKFEGGDKIHLLRGDTWKVPLEFPTSGDMSSNPIVITDYGHRSNNRARIALSLTPYVACDLSGIIVENVEVSDCSDGIAFNFTNEGKAYSNIQVTNVFFNNIINMNYTSPNSYDWGTAIRFNMVKNLVMSDVSVKNCVVKNADTTFRPRGCSAATFHRVSFDGNTMLNNSFNVLGMYDGSHSWIIRNNVFFHNTPRSYFQWGTTDVIIDSVDSTNKILDNDFVSRGEYPGSFDGCAIDYETASNGVEVRGNMISHSTGGGIMVFANGHTSSQNVLIRDNVFIEAGCLQTENDRGAIAFCDYSFTSTGTVENNFIVNCTNGVEPFHEFKKGASEGFKFKGNKIVESADGYIVETPKIRVSQQAGSKKVTMNCGTKGAVIRYTLDGSRPNEKSMLYNKEFSVEGNGVAINAKAFKESMYASITESVIV